MDEEEIDNTKAALGGNGLPRQRIAKLLKVHAIAIKPS